MGAAVWLEKIYRVPEEHSNINATYLDVTNSTMEDFDSEIKEEDFNY